MRWLLIFLWCVSSLAWAAPTKEQQEKAVALYEEAETYYRLLNYNKALTLYQEAYVISRETSLLFNIGQCYRLLGRYQEAKATYELYLRDAPTSEYRAACERFLQEVNDAIANGPPTPIIASQPSALTPLPREKAAPQAPSTKMFLIPAGLGVASLGLGGAALLVNRNLSQETDATQTAELRGRRLALSLSSDAALLLGLGTLTAFTIEHLRWRLSTKEAR